MPEHAPGSDWIYVGLRRRTGAALVDSLLLGVLIAPLWIVDARTGGHPAFIAHADTAGTIHLRALVSGVSGPADIVFGWLVPALAVLLFWLAREATPGKMLVGARIVDARSGQRPRAGQYLARYLGYYVSALPLGLGLLWIAFDPRKQGWHDKLSGTVVVRPATATKPASAFDQECIHD